MRLKGLILIFVLSACRVFSQATLPVSRTTWSATPTGWTDNYAGQTYTSALACDGNTNRAKLSATGHYTQVFFSGVPGVVSFDMQGNGVDAASSLKIEESADGSTWNTLGTISSISGSCVTYTYAVTCVSLYIKWTYTKSLGNISIDNVSITASTCPVAATCPVLTGAIVNSCNNPGCNEGDAEIMFFNAGSNPITVSSFTTNTVNYYGSTVNFNAGTINAYTGAASANSSTTSTLNGFTGCTGSFIDASAAGTIPAYATFIMVPISFCPTNYNFSNICASFSPIYVVYYDATGWNSSGNLANYQSGSNPKYLTTNFSWIGGCGTTYYSFDAGSEYSGGTGSGDGASIAFPSTVSTSSASPTAANYYSSGSDCTLPIVLPIDLISFRASLAGINSASIKFTTLAEENVRQYNISKSVDGFNFSLFTRVQARNKIEKSDYVLYDEVNPEVNTLIYYRLEEEDLNGRKKLAATSVLEVRSAKNIIVTQGEAEVNLFLPIPAKEVELFTLDGRNVFSGNENYNGLSYKISMAGCAKGFYLLKIVDTDDKVTVKKIIY
ncbi:MAG: T9SS type A sorting domain-containing protein [Bacteroidia bacterium]